MRSTKVQFLLKKMLFLLTATGIVGASAFAQQQPTSLAYNLANPSKLVVLGNGGFLTVQAGTRPNRGAVYFFDSQGDFSYVLLGLPGTGQSSWTTAPAGPDGLAAYGNTLYIATGQVTPNGIAPSSATAASILRVTFNRNPADSPGPFLLQPTDYQTLLNGGAVTLTQGSNDTAIVTLLVNSVNGPTDLSVDASTGRLYIVSREDHTISWVPLQ